MLHASSGQICDDLYLLTLGNTCRYALTHDAGIALFDCGTSAHSGALIKRLAAHSLIPEHLTQLFLTSLSARSLGAAPQLSSRTPGAKVYASSRSAELLTDGKFRNLLLGCDRDLCAALHSSSTLTPGDFENLKPLPLNPGARVSLDQEFEVITIGFDDQTSSNLCYHIPARRALICGSALDLFRGPKPPAPAGCISLAQLDSALAKIAALDLDFLCLASFGALSGTQVTRHIDGLRRSIDSLRNRTAPQSEEQWGLLPTVLREEFYSAQSADPVIGIAVEDSFQALWRQLYPERPLTN